MACRLRVSFALAVAICFTQFGFTQQTDNSPILNRLGCSRAVNDVAISADGSLLAAACGRWSGWGGVRLWRTKDWSAASTLGKGEGEKHFYKKVDISPSGNLVAGITEGGVMSVWRTATGVKLTETMVRNDIPESVQFLTENKVVVLTGEILYEIAVRTGEKRTIAKEVQTVGVSPNRTRIAIATKKALQIRSLPTYKVEKTLPTDFPFFARIAPDDSFLVTGGGGIAGRKSVEFRSLPSGEVRQDLTSFRAGVFAAAINNSGTSAVLAGGTYGGGGDISVWSVSDGVQTGYRSFGRMPFESVAWAPDGTYFAAGSADGYVVLYATQAFRGPQVEEQEESICATVVTEEGHPTLRPLARVPTPNRQAMHWAWGLSLEGEPDWAKEGAAVAVEKWAISRTAGEDTAIVRVAKPVSNSPESVTIGDISNPGWNRGLLIRVYGDNQFIASTNTGKCLAYGRLSDTVPAATFNSLTAQLQAGGFAALPADPLARGIDHFRIKFISQTSGNKSEIRSDAPGTKGFDDLYAVLLQMLDPVAKLAPPLEMPAIHGLAVPK